MACYHKKAASCFPIGNLRFPSAAVTQPEHPPQRNRETSPRTPVFCSLIFTYLGYKKTPTLRVLKVGIINILSYNYPDVHCHFYNKILNLSLIHISEPTRR